MPAPGKPALAALMRHTEACLHQVCMHALSSAGTYRALRSFLLGSYGAACMLRLAARRALSDMRVPTC